MTRVAYVQCGAGVAGDMVLGALVDAGADAERVVAAVAAVDIGGWALAFERVQRAGLMATWANVVVGDHHDGDHHDEEHDGDGEHQPHRPASEVRRLLDEADLAEPIRRRARAVFDTLAEAEGAVHGVAPEDVEFHEVGAVDAIVDVVGIAAALDTLGIDEVVAGPVATGRGTVSGAHGTLPNPAPAVARLLAARRVPVIGVDTELELSTPTGVATLVALASSFGAMPAMTVTSVGYGAGRADTPGRPNVVQVVLGEVTAPATTPQPGRPAIQLEVNVDDVSGEVIAHTIAALIAAGAHDAWATPVLMKKGRPAFVVSALGDPASTQRLAAVLLAETGSLGVRATTVARWPQVRRDTVVDVDGHAVAVKVADGRVKVEHDDAAAAARALGRPLRQVLAEAERLGRSLPSP